MQETIFILFLTIAVGIIGFAFIKRDSAFLSLGCVLLAVTGLMLLDQSPDSGIEEIEGFGVTHLGDNNFSIVLNKSFQNAGNDIALNALGNLFLYTGVIGLAAAFGYTLFSKGEGAVK